MTEGRIGRLAIVNRGECAMRAILAVRELNAEREQPIQAIALFSEPERRAMFVRRADEAYCVGPLRAYHDLRALERVLVGSRADGAWWVGWGFVAERPEFAELCERLGILFVGPDGAAMRRLGDKVNAKLLAEDAGVPMAVERRAGDHLGGCKRHAADIGLPLMIKAITGGGGRSCSRDRSTQPSARKAASPTSISRWGRARRFSRSAYGHRHVPFERYLYMESISRTLWGCRLRHRSASPKPAASWRRSSTVSASSTRRSTSRVAAAASRRSSTPTTWTGSSRSLRTWPISAPLSRRVRRCGRPARRRSRGSRSRPISA